MKTEETEEADTYVETLLQEAEPKKPTSPKRSSCSSSLSWQQLKGPGSGVGLRAAHRLVLCVYVCVRACSIISNSLRLCGLLPSTLLCPWNSPGENAGVGCPFLLQRIFLTQGSNAHLLHWQVYSLLLSYLGISIGLFMLTRTRAITKGDKWMLKPGLISVYQTQVSYLRIAVSLEEEKTFVKRICPEGHLLVISLPEEDILFKNKKTV